MSFGRCPKTWYRKLPVRNLVQSSFPRLFDATGGGATGDNPGLLSVLLPHRDRLSACLFIVDREIADEAHRLGLGRNLRGHVGAKF